MKRLYNFSFLPLIITIIGILFTGLIAWKSAEWISKTEEERFLHACNHTTLLVQKKLDINVQLLLSAAALIDISENITAKEWKIFAQKQEMFENFHGLQALGYAPHTQEGFPITYLEPLTSYNQKAIGFNMAGEPIRKKAIEQAIQSGAATFSSKIELVQEKNPNERAGFVIYMPIYEKGKNTNSPQERMEASKGVVYAAMKAKTLFGDLLDAEYSMIDLEIYDGNTPLQANLLYDAKSDLFAPRLERYTTVNFYGKEWTLYFKADKALDMDFNRYVPWAQLFFGTLFSIIVGLWMYALQRTRKEAYAIAKEKTQQLLVSESRVRTIFQVMQEGIIVHDAQGVITECNLAVQDILGISADTMIGKIGADSRWQAIHEDGTQFTLEEKPATKVLLTGIAQRNIVMGIHREDGELIWIMANAQPVLSDDFEKISSVVVTISDISAVRASQYQLGQYIEIIDANVIISSTDCSGIITEVSEAFCKISGYSKEEIIGQSHGIVRHPDTPDSFYKEMWKELGQGHTWKGEMQNRRKDGSSYWIDNVISPRYNEKCEMIGYTAIRQDITDKKRIEELSIKDTLTGLYNRLKLDELFAMNLSLAARHKSSFSIIMLDIDKFKLVNDTYGHQVGDSLLKEIAMLLRENVRLEDALGRWGGEEFLILLPSTTLEAARILAELLRERTQKFLFSVVGTKTISLGVATFNQGDDEKSMISRADEALYRAKENGRNRVEVEMHHCDLPV